MYNLILKHIGVFIVKFNHLSLILMSLLFISCGETQSYTTTDQKSIIDYPTTGSGTFASPYEIGGGLYQFKDEKYYSINVIRDECNVLVYGVKNFDSLSDLLFIDDSHSQEIVPTYNYLYENLPRDGYDLVVNSDSYATFGVFSPCIDDDYSKTDAFIVIEAGERITLTQENALYKFTLSRIGKFILNTTDDDIQVRLYDHNMNALYNETDNKHEKAIDAGDYYILLSKISRDDINFVFDTSGL